MLSFSIGQVAQQAGVASSTIRYYERIGLLPPPPRSSGKRRYDESIVSKLAIIRLAQAAGLSLTEIVALLYDFPAQTSPAERWQTIADGKIAEIDALIQQALLRKAFLIKAQDCDCATLDDCAAGFIEAAPPQT